MATKFCSYHNEEHILEDFPQKNGKPHGTVCKKARTEKGAQLAEKKKKEKQLAMTQTELELELERDKIMAETTDPKERKRLLDNLKAKRARLRQKEAHIKGTAKKITEKICNGALCNGALLSVDKFSTQQYGNGYQTYCKECVKHNDKQKSNSFKEIDPLTTFKTCKNPECKCENPQPLTKFDLHVNYEFGRNDICKICRAIERSKLNYPPKQMGTKFCTGCKIDHDVSKFHVDKYEKDGLHSCCKKCQNERQRVSYSKYPQAVKLIFNCCKQNAKKRKIQFAITVQDIDTLYKKQNGLCAITGISLTHDYMKERTEDDSHIINKHNMSIDRINNNKGYTPDNIQLVCAIINRLKHTMNSFELMLFSLNVGHNNIKKKAQSLPFMQDVLELIPPITLTTEMKNRIEQKYKYTVSNAKTRNLKVEITQEYLNQLYIAQNGKCAITGKLITCNGSTCDISVDRIDSKKHYVVGNVQLVLDSSNKHKADFTNKELDFWTRSIRKSDIFLSQLLSI